MTEAAWSLKQYVSSGGRRCVDDWRKSLPTQQRTDFDAFVRYITKKSDWVERKDFRWLSGKKYKSLAELVWSSGKIQHRIIGYFAGRKEFVCLIGCTHKGKQYNPTDALNSAVKRKNRIYAGESTLEEYEPVD